MRLKPKKSMMLSLKDTSAESLVYKDCLTELTSMDEDEDWEALSVSLAYLGWCSIFITIFLTMLK